MATKKATVKRKATPKLQVYQSHLRSGENGENWYWRLLATNGRIVADGAEGYSSKSKAKRAALNAHNLMFNAEIVVEG